MNVKFCYWSSTTYGYEPENVWVVDIDSGFVAIADNAGSAYVWPVRTGMSAPRFTDNGDDTVTDNNTKLIWSKDLNICGRKGWQDACSFCAGLSMAGHSDWRLPSMSEFNSIIDTKQHSPALPLGHPFVNMQNESYWSSDQYQPDPYNYAWLVDLDTGKEYVNQKEAGRRTPVWPVRSGN